MTRSHSASLGKSTNSDALAASERNVHALARPAGVSLLRLSAAERALGASFIVALLWGAVFWALH
jgi:hypothetical protein